MFKLRLEANVNPPIDVRISSVIESGNSRWMNHLLTSRKSMMSQMLPFFFGIPKLGLAQP